MLRDNNLGDSFLFRVFFVLIFSVNKDNNIRVLFYRTAFSQIREHRLVIGAALHRARELRQGDDRYVQLARQPFQSARDLRDLLHAVFGAAGGHQLQVIDDDQIETMLSLQAAGLGADIHDVGGGRVVDVDRGFTQPAEGTGDAVPFVVVDLPQAQAVRIDPSLHREDTLHELLGRHLQAEDADRFAVSDRGAVGHAKGQARLSHRRTSGDDD